MELKEKILAWNLNPKVPKTYTKFWYTIYKWLLKNWGSKILTWPPKS